MHGQQAEAHQSRTSARSSTCVRAAQRSIRLASAHARAHASSRRQRCACVTHRVTQRVTHVSILAAHAPHASGRHASGRATASAASRARCPRSRPWHAPLLLPAHSALSGCEGSAEHAGSTGCAGGRTGGRAGGSSRAGGRARGRAWARAAMRAPARL